MAQVFNDKTAISYSAYHKKTDFVDSQFEFQPNRRVPYKSIALATVLFLGGTILIFIAALLVAGVIDAKYGDRFWPLIILGSIMFIPGAYHVRIAIWAYYRYPGFSYEDIPDYD